MARVVAKERIAVTEDREAVVPEGHGAARFLLVGEGCEIAPDDVKRYGLRDGRLPKDWEERLSRSRERPEETK